LRLIFKKLVYGELSASSQLIADTYIFSSYI
jgi:hypothetical protein